jgi:cytochrome P450
LDQKKRLDEFTRKMINRRKEAMKSGEVGERKSLLDYMLEISDNHPNFNEDDIVDEVCTFMLAVSCTLKVRLKRLISSILKKPREKRKEEHDRGQLKYISDEMICLTESARNFLN